MNYQALLFCPDDKTARVVTQVLTDLEFRVEPCSEPFAAVKMLMGQRFDAVVVDCENEQNATLLFKSARNSSLNHSALSVAVVEGQAGVAKAFRLGANLVLTKPINVEQSKGTLRVARGLLRKADASRPASEPQTAPPTAPVSAAAQIPTPRSSAAMSSAPATPVRVNPPVVAKPVPHPALTQQPARVATIERQIPAGAASAFELEPESSPKLDPVEAALLESMPETKLRAQSGNGSSASTQEYAWQTSTKPQAPATTPSAPAYPETARAVTVTQPSSPLTMASAKSTSAAQASAAATAPAKEALAVPVASGAAVASVPEHEPAEAEVSVPQANSAATAFTKEPALFSSVEAHAASDEGSNLKKISLVAAVVLIAVGGAYFGLTKMHSKGTAVTTSQAPSVQPASPLSSASESPAVSAQVTAAPLPAASSTVVVAGQPAPARPTAAKNAFQGTDAKPSKATDTKSPDAEVAADTPAPLMVQGGRMPSPPPTPSAADPDAPAIDMASNNSAGALAGIVNTSGGSIPKPSPQHVQVSQGVSQGLLVKKVNPVYPRQAQQNHIEGAVQLLATIAEDGSISGVKVLKGDPILAGAASDAVRQWKYKPYYLDGQPVAIQTQITLNFKLP